MPETTEIHRIEASMLIISDDLSGAAFVIPRIEGREHFAAVRVKSDGVYLVDGAERLFLLEGMSTLDAQLVADLSAVVVREERLDDDASPTVGNEELPKLPEGAELIEKFDDGSELVRIPDELEKEWLADQTPEAPIEYAIRVQIDIAPEYGGMSP